MESNILAIPTKDSNDLKEVIEFILNNLKSQVVIQSCNILGIPNEQLIQKNLTDFEDQQNSKSVQLLRFQHYEARRKACLNVIAQYLVEHEQFFEPFNSKSRSHSYVGKHKNQPDIVPCVPISPREASARKLKIAKENIIKRIKFEQKRKDLMKKIDEERLAREAIINNKLSKSVKKEAPSKFFEVHDKRVQEILKKKYQSQQEHEFKAQIYPEYKKSECRPQSNSFHYSNRRTLLQPQPSDEEIEKKLQKISSKLKNSSERAKVKLKQKSTNLSMPTKVQHNKEKLESKQETEKIMKLVKIQQDLEDSNKRREELILNEQKRRAVSSKRLEVRHIEEQLKNEQEMMEKLKEMEGKEEKREKSRKVRKEIIERTAQEISSKNFLRKKEQERNLKEIDKGIRDAKNELIEKIRDGENGVRHKAYIDYAKLKIRLEKEMMKSENKQ